MNYPTFPTKCKYCIDDKSKPYYSCSKTKDMICNLAIIDCKTYCKVLEEEMKECGSQYVTGSSTQSPSDPSP